MRVPISAMILLSNTSFQKRQPAAENSAAGFPQQLSIFLAGKFASHFGGMAQFTYTHADDQFWHGQYGSPVCKPARAERKRLAYGITLNNNPTVEDLWNSTPAWGFPGSQHLRV